MSTELIKKQIERAVETRESLVLHLTLSSSSKLKSPLVSGEALRLRFQARLIGTLSELFGTKPEKFSGLEDVWSPVSFMESKQGPYKVDDFQGLERFLSQRPLRLPMPMVVIDSLESVSTAIWNRLLKLLEDPPQATLFFLLNAAGSDLMPTIHSRCQHRQMALGDAQLPEEWSRQMNALEEKGKRLLECWDKEEDLSKRLDLLKNNPELEENLLGRYSQELASQTGCVDNKRELLQHLQFLKRHAPFHNSPTAGRLQLLAFQRQK